jgi:thioredoxin-related protein
MISPYRILLLILALPFAVAHAVDIQEGDELFVDDAPLEQRVEYPPWFRLSFLDMPDEIREITAFNKRGLILYFGQEYCPYCKAMLENNFGSRDIERYTNSNFDVLAIDIHGQKRVVNLQGKEMSEKEFADTEKVNLTPTLVFYDKKGIEALRLQGYYPPYKFRAALEFVADEHYRDESFRDYLQRANPPMAFELGGLNQEDFFQPPPYVLDRRKVASKMPLLVFFEQGNCHACDVLHTAPLQSEAIRKLLDQFEIVQLDVTSDTPVITPAGEHTTSKRWAESLGLFYTPTLLFFDGHGRSVMRLDSVAGFYRLRKVLEYVLAGDTSKGGLLRFNHTGKDKP